MHEAFLKDTLKDLIVDNQITLTKNLLAQGEMREIAHVTTSILTPPAAYYYISIHCEESAESSAHNRNRQTRTPPRQATYQLAVNIVDAPEPDVADVELYDKQHKDFDKFVDRLAKLIEEQASVGTGPKFKLQRGDFGAEDRVINRTNIPQPLFNEAEEYAPLLISQLRFTMVQECVDNSVLYPS